MFKSCLILDFNKKNLTIDTNRTMKMLLNGTKYESTKMFKFCFNTKNLPGICKQLKLEMTFTSHKKVLEYCLFGYIQNSKVVSGSHPVGLGCF